MQAAHIKQSTLRGYTRATNEYIIAPLGDKFLAEVTADDIKLAMVALANKPEDVYNRVHMIFKSIFYSALYNDLIRDNPAEYLKASGGIPRKVKQPLTDEQVKILLDTVRDLPVYLFVMIGLYAGMRKEEILGLRWDCVFLDCEVPYISVRRAWHSFDKHCEVNTELKTKAARRDIPIPGNLIEALKIERERSNSDYVISNKEGSFLAAHQFVGLWHYIVVRSTRERTMYKYINGTAVKRKFKPVVGQKCATREGIVYTIDFDVTPHLLRHTYITNLIAAGVDPKTVQYLAGHENSKVTMDIYAKAKYNRPEDLSGVVNKALNPVDKDKE